MLVPPFRCNHTPSKEQYSSIFLSPFCSGNMAESSRATSIRAEFPSGKLPTTRVRLRISRMILSSGLLVFILIQCCSGKNMYQGFHVLIQKPYSRLYEVSFLQASGLHNAAFFKASSRSSWACIALSIATTFSYFSSRYN